MNKITKKQSFTKLAVVIAIIVALTLTIGLVSTNKAFALGEENEIAYFVGQESVVNLNNVVKNNSPSEAAPIMTVLTHGLGESAYAWSGSDGIFGYESDSLIEQLAGDRDSKNTIVFWAGVKERVTATTCKFLFKELNQINNYSTKDDISFNIKTELSIEDAAKHIILVFEGSQDENSLQGNAAAYSELQYVINKVMYDLMYWGVQNPRINLIGHGRGGILNLMYAAEYKHNVASMYSIGTPYSGSSTLNFMKTALGDGGSDIHKYINSVAANEIISSAGQNLANWNEVKGYVDVHALGSAMRIDFLKDFSGVLSEILGVLNQIKTINSTQELLDLAKQNEKILGLPGQSLNHMMGLLDMAERINKAYSFIDIFGIMRDYRTDLNNYYVESLDSLVHEAVQNALDNASDSEEAVIRLFLKGIGYHEGELFLGDVITILSASMGINSLTNAQEAVYNGLLEQFINIKAEKLVADNFGEIILKKYIAYEKGELDQSELPNGLLAQVEVFKTSTREELRDPFYMVFYGHENGNENNTNEELVVASVFFKNLFVLIGSGFALGLDDDFELEDIFRSQGVDFIKLQKMINNALPAIGDFLTQGTLAGLNGALLLLDGAAYVPGSQIVLTVFVDYLYAAIIAPVLAVADIVNFDWEFTKSQIGLQAIAMLNTEIVRKNYLGNTSLIQKVQVWNDDFVWLNDGFVNSSSQLAENFDGVKRRLFLDESVSDIVYKPSSSQVPIPLSHNFQTRNPEILNYIVEDIDGKLGNAVFADTYRILDDERAELIRIGGATKTQSSVVIPNNYEGREIIGITRNAFSTSVGSNITSITLPDSIKNIGDRAFAGNESLLTVYLPTSLETIGKEAFDGCSALQNINIPASTYSLGENAFFGCTNLNITVASGNIDFRAQNNILYNDDLSRIIFAGNISTSIVLSNAVTTIDSFAFYKSRVQSINLANTLTIGSSAFEGSHLTTVNGGNSLLAVGMHAFESTPWLNANHTNGMAVVGNTLIKYKGYSSNITAGLFPSGVTSIGSGAFYESVISRIQLPDTITRIGDYAFSYSRNLTEIVFSEFINFIGGYSFRGCYSLNAVKFYGLNTPIIGINAFDGNGEGRSISVPFGSENAYKSYSTLAKYSSSVVTLSITINYISNGQPLLSSSVPYYGILANMPAPTRTGYTFGGWYVTDDPSENVGYQNGNVCLLKDGANLYARWTPINYSISYYPDGAGGSSTFVGATPLNFTIETNTFTLPAPPVRTGYTFFGWFSNTNLTGTAVVSVAKGTTGNKAFYAKWTANTYTVTLDKNATDATISSSSQTVTFGSAFTLPVPTRIGYIFEGWYDSNNFTTGVRYATENGASTKNWDKAVNATFYAKWRTKVYTLRIDNNTDAAMKLFLSANGLSLTATSVMFGSDFNIKSFIDNVVANISTLPPDLKNFWFYKGHKIAGLMLGNGASFGWTGDNVPDLGADQTLIDIYINWEKETHKLWFYSEGDTLMLNPLSSSFSALYDSNIVLPTAAKSGYTFAGWRIMTISAIIFTEANANNIFAYTKMPDISSYLMEDANMRLMEEWTANNYDVMLDNQSGTGGTISVSATYNSNMPSATAPTRTGYAFAGYWTGINGTGTKYYNANMSSTSKWNIASSSVLYAQWTIVNYNITYNLNSGTNASGNPTSYNIETNNIVLANPTRKYYQFDGWYENSAFTGSKVTVINEGSVNNKTFYAKWKGTASTNTTNVVNEVSIVTVSTSNLSIVIGNAVTEVTFIGSSSTTVYTGISIDITSRSTSLIIRFVRIRMTGKANMNLVNAVNCPDLTVDVEGTVVLNGGTVTTTTITEEQVSGAAVLYLLSFTLYKNVFNELRATYQPAVIKAVALSITGTYDANANLSIYGGSGSGYASDNCMGSSGGNGIVTSSSLYSSVKTITIRGGNGYVGKEGNIGSTPSAPPQAATAVVGTTGYQGGDGGNGGYGGWGGLGISVGGTLTVTSNTTFISTGGNGAQGGKGGMGGQGGTGGQGGNGAFLKTAKKGGQGGRAGTGGNGGTGGAAGTNYISGSASSLVVLTRGSAGAGGAAGESGARGLGGKGGQKYNSSNFADWGDMGEYGSSGEVGGVFTF